MEKLPLSVIILAKDEEARIPDCIKSVQGWAGEIVVIDDESRDKTKEISESLGARVIVRKMDIEGRHRNWSYGEAKNEWILSLDADERPTEGLKREIKDKIFSNPEENVFAIPRRNFIGDYWIKGGGQYPASQIKLFRKGKFKWEEVEVHPVSMTTGARGSLVNDLIHYTYRDWADFIKKLNRQTTLEAIKWYKLSLDDPKKAAWKMNTAHAIWRVFDRFRRTYIAKKGYKDGFIGFMIAYFSSLYQIVSYAKYRELSQRKH